MANRGKAAEKKAAAVGKPSDSRENPGQYSDGTERSACDKGGESQDGGTCEEGFGIDWTRIAVSDSMDCLGQRPGERF